MGFAYDPICPGMILELSDEQAAALEKEPTAIIEGDRYFMSPRIQTLREIRNMIRPEPKGAPAMGKMSRVLEGRGVEGIS